MTGARADRRELNRMLGKLGPGDMVTVTRIDRLARSTFDLFAIASWTRRRNSDPWRNCGLTAPAAPGA
jgi:DNA invertase Pin-like site-specific DNA recombinase